MAVGSVLNSRLVLARPAPGNLNDVGPSSPRILRPTPKKNTSKVCSLKEPKDSVELGSTGRAKPDPNINERVLSASGGNFHGDESPRARAKRELMKLLVNSRGQVGATAYMNEARHKEIHSAAKQLARFDPSQAPATKEGWKNMGEWTLMYASNPQIRGGGKIGPCMGKTNQLIDLEGLMEDRTALGNGLFTVSFTGSWSPMDSRSWCIHHTGMHLKVLNILDSPIIRVPKDISLLSYWSMAYVDDNLRIMNAFSSKSLKTRVGLRELESGKQEKEPEEYNLGTKSSLLIYVRSKIPIDTPQLNEVRERERVFVRQMGKPTFGLSKTRNGMSLGRGAKKNKPPKPSAT